AQDPGCEGRDRIDRDLQLVDVTGDAVGHAEDAFALARREQLAQHGEVRQHAVEAVERNDGAAEIDGIGVAGDLPFHRQADRRAAGRALGQEQHVAATLEALLEMREAYAFALQQITKAGERTGREEARQERLVRYFEAVDLELAVERSFRALSG